MLTVTFAVRVAVSGVVVDVVMFLLTMFELPLSTPAELTDLRAKYLVPAERFDTVYVDRLPAIVIGVPREVLDVPW